MSASALLVSPQGRLRAGWRAALFLVVLVVLVALANALLGVAIVASADVGESPYAARVHYLLLQAGAYAAVALGALAANWVMLRFVDRGSWSYVGLARRNLAARRVAAGFAAGAIAIAMPCALLIAVGWLAVSASEARMFSPPAEAALALLVLVPAALAEELMMRGYLLSALADALGRWWALLGTSVLFAVLHVRNPGMTSEALAVVALAGVFLGAVRYATSSLYAAWAAHLAWNVALGVAFHALVSGTVVAESGWRTLDSGPDWATGGSWGPEGGIAAAAGLVAAILLVVRRPRLLGAGDANVISNA